MNKLVVPNEIMLAEVSSLIAEGKEVIIMTKGSSMLPFIRGDADSVALVAKDPVAPGDISLAEIAKGKYVLHRVRKVEAGVVTLKGDGNLTGIERCAEVHVCGVVKTILKASGREIDPASGWQRLMWRCWVLIPRLGRRFILHFARKNNKTDND